MKRKSVEAASNLSTLSPAKTRLLLLLARDPQTTARLRLISRASRDVLEEPWDYFKSNTYVTETEIRRFVALISNPPEFCFKIFYYPTAEELESSAQVKEIIFDKELLRTACDNKKDLSANLITMLSIIKSRQISQFIAGRIAFKQILTLISKTISEAGNFSADAKLPISLMFTIDMMLKEEIDEVSCFFLSDEEARDPSKVRQIIRGKPNVEKGNLIFCFKLCAYYRYLGCFPRLKVLTKYEFFEALNSLMKFVGGENPVADVDKPRIFCYLKNLYNYCSN